MLVTDVFTICNLCITPGHSHWSICEMSSCIHTLMHCNVLGLKVYSGSMCVCANIVDCSMIVLVMRLKINQSIKQSFIYCSTNMCLYCHSTRMSVCWHGILQHECMLVIRLNNKSIYQSIISAAQVCAGYRFLLKLPLITQNTVL